MAIRQMLAAAHLVRVAEIYANSILALDRSEKQPVSDASASELGDEPAE